MHIHLGKRKGQLSSIELDSVTHHRAIVHLNKLLNPQKAEHISKIHISHSSLNHEDCQALKNIFHTCHELTDIDLEANHLDLVQAQSLLKSIQGQHITSLALTDNWIGEHVSPDFFAFMNSLHDLHHLDLTLNWLGDKGMITFLDFLNPEIKTLCLACNDFNLKGVSALCDAVVNKTKLEELDISYNQLDSAGAAKIAELMSQSSSLKRLKVNSNCFGDKGINLLIHSLRENNTLEELDCSDNFISKSAATLLETACESSNLKRLNLKHNQLNHEEIKPLIHRIKRDGSQLRVLY